MKETHIEFLGGGKSIRPTLNYPQREHTTSMHTESNDDDFSDMRMGYHHKYLEGENK